MATNTPSIDQLKRALSVSQEIETLQAELASILGSSAPVSSAREATPGKAASKPGPKGGRRKLSPEAREKIAAAARARWARAKGTSAPAAPKAAAPGRKKGGLTPEGRAKLAASMKARWAARKKGGPAINKSANAKAAPKKSVGRAKGRRTVSPEARARMAAAAKKRWAIKKG